MRKAPDVVVQIGEPRRLLYLGGGRVGLRQRDVVGDGPGEQEGLLRHPRDGAAQRTQRVVAQLRRTPANRTLLRGIVPQQQREQRRLAGPGGTHDPERRPRSERQGDVVERGRGHRAPRAHRHRRIGEGHPVEADRPLGRGQDRAVVVDRQRRAQYRVEARPGRPAALDQRKHPAGGEHRPDQLPEVHGECRQHPDGHLLAPDQPATDGEGQCRRDGQRHADRGLERRLPLLRVEGRVARRTRPLLELAHGAGLETQRTQRAHRRDGLLHVLVEAGEAIERQARRAMYVARDEEEGDGHERERQQRDPSEAPVDAEGHHRHDEHQRQAAVEPREEGLPGDHLDRVDVVGGERHQVAGALPMEVRRTLKRQPLVQADPEFDAEPEGGGKKLQAPADAEKIDRHAHGDENGQFTPQRTAMERPGHEGVDDVPDPTGNPHRQHRDQHQHRPGARVGTPMATGEAQDQLRKGHGRGSRRIGGTGGNRRRPLL